MINYEQIASEVTVNKFTFKCKVPDDDLGVYVSDH